MSSIMKVDSIEITEPTIQAPANIIAADEDLSIVVKWNFTPAGAFAPVDGDTYLLRLFFEAIGPGQEFGFPETGSLVIPVIPGTNSYSYNVIIKAGTLNPGVYRVTVVLLYNRKDSEANRITAFSEGPILQVYSTRFF